MHFDALRCSVVAVLDWELSTLGDRLSDVAYNLMVFHIHHKNKIMQGLKGNLHSTVATNRTCLTT